MVLTTTNPTAVTPKIWRDQHLLRILTERGGVIALTLWKRRTVLSLCLPYLDRAILSLGRTQCLWSGCGSFTPTRASNMSLFKVLVALAMKTLSTAEGLGVWKDWRVCTWREWPPTLLLIWGASWWHLIYADFQEVLQTRQFLLNSQHHLKP